MVKLAAEPCIWSRHYFLAIQYRAQTGFQAVHTAVSVIHTEIHIVFYFLFIYLFSSTHFGLHHNAVNRFTKNMSNESQVCCIAHCTEIYVLVLCTLIIVFQMYYFIWAGHQLIADWFLIQIKRTIFRVNKSAVRLLCWQAQMQQYISSLTYIIRQQ